MNPALAVGAAGVASPILIHLLARRRFRKVRWAAMDFLLDAQKRNRRRIRFEQFILLALRCLAVLFLALMVARPFVAHSSIAGLMGIGPRTERIILLDDSYSMDCTSGPAETIWTRAVRAAEQIAATTASEDPGDPAQVILTSRPGQPLVTVPNLNTETLADIKGALVTTATSQQPAHIERAASFLMDMLKRAGGQSNTTIYFISDFQRPDWADYGPQNPSPMAQFKSLGETGRKVQLVFIDVSQPSPRNLAISDIRALQPQSIAGIPARYEVAVANYGPDSVSHVELSLGVGEHALPPVSLPVIGAGQQVRQQIELSFPLEGATYLRTQLTGSASNSDPLRLDNTRYAAVDVLSAIQILLVDGEPSADSFRDEVYLLKTALRPSGRAASGNEVTVVEEQELDTAELGRYHVLALANVARLSAAGLKNVETFVENGGGLIIFAGDQVDFAWYNEHMYQAGRGLMPVPLVETVEVVKGADPYSFSQWDDTHPVLRAFQDSLAKLLRQVKVYSFLKCGEPKSLPHTDSAPANSDVRVVARWNDSEKSPAFAEKRFGRGTCALISTSADQEWNDWAANFSYVPFMLELMQNTARAPDDMDAVTVGTPLKFPADSQKYSASASIRPPDYPADPEIAITAGRNDGVQNQFVIKDTRKVGVYELRMQTNRGEPLDRYGVVNPDATESDLTPSSDAQVQAAMGDMPFERIRNIEKLLSDSGSMRTEIWWPLLLLAVGTLMTEQCLAWYFGTRG